MKSVAVLEAYPYPLDVKCRLCKRERGNHNALSSACPLGRLTQHQQFYSDQFFKPQVPKVPIAVARAVTKFQRSLEIRGGIGLEELDNEGEYLRWSLFFEMKRALEISK